jgi:isopentenyl-diphosphate delta-isomerase
MENLILVNSNDDEIGTEEKWKCHMGKGKLHRSLSIFVFNKKGELLLQKRSEEKLLWPLYWSNACCTHPKNGEIVEKAAHRRLEEEMGFDCDLKEIFYLRLTEDYDVVYAMLLVLLKSVNLCVTHIMVVLVVILFTKVR